MFNFSHHQWGNFSLNGEGGVARTWMVWPGDELRMEGSQEQKCVCFY